MSGSQVAILHKSLGFGFHFRIVRNGSAVGVFDSNSSPQLAVATETHKIIFQNMESIFHINEPVTVIDVYSRFVNAGGPLDIIGTDSSLLAFDVFNNKTVFHKSMPEGVNCLKIGKLDDHLEPLIICGCGTTIWCFELNGPPDSHVFWTALGDEITALELCDLDGDGNNELLVGTKGTEIKAFKNLGIWGEFDEGDSVSTLCSLSVGTFAFGLLTGVVGVYSNGERLWRAKTKSQIINLLPFPDAKFVACVWNNGKIDLRASQDGEIRAKEQIDGEVVSALIADLTGDNQCQLLVVFQTGQVRGFVFRQEELSIADQKQQVIHNYSQRKHVLLQELRSYEQNSNSIVDNGMSECSTVPSDTILNSALELALDRNLVIRLSLSNNVPIRTVLLFAEGVFPTECWAYHPNKNETSNCEIHIMPPKNVLAEVFIKVFGGYAVEKSLRVFELNIVLPKFVTFIQAHDNLASGTPESRVEFNLRIRQDQLRSWLTGNFHFFDVNRLSESGQNTQIRFYCLRNFQILQMDINSTGEIRLYHDDIQNCGDIIQSIAHHLGTKELRSYAYFPALIRTVNETIISVMNDGPINFSKSSFMQERYDIDDRLSSEQSEQLNRVRESVVRAEDCLATQNFVDAKKLYSRSVVLNQELVTQKTIRTNARNQLLDSLKMLNITIEQFSRLRVGSASTRLIEGCRNFISEDNLKLLPKLLEYGGE